MSGVLYDVVPFARNGIFVYVVVTLNLMNNKFGIL
jgi:hypothetical protein